MAQVLPLWQRVGRALLWVPVPIAVNDLLISVQQFDENDSDTTSFALLDKFTFQMSWFSRGDIVTLRWLWPSLTSDGVLNFV